MTPKRKSREGTKAAVKFRFNFQRLETHVDMTTKQWKNSQSLPFTRCFHLGHGVSEKANQHLFRLKW